MAKQNYRCAGCGIRTDPGKALSSPRGGDRADMGRRKEGLEQEGC